MNPFLNPYFLLRILKSYLIDIDVLRRMDVKKLKEYQDKNLRRVVKKAYDVPLYHKKYKIAGIHPSDIRGIQDIQKLPCISKHDLLRTPPEELVPPTFNRKKAIVSYTSGSTGPPVAIYFDMLTTIQELLGYVRVLKEHGANWLKHRITIIVDLSENSIESEYLTSWVLPSLKPLFSLHNIQIFNTYDNAEEHIHDINRFRPEFIVGYPGMLRQLAILKRKGQGNNIHPRGIISTGSILTPYIKKDFEDTFNAHVFDAYGAMESGPLAFQCTKRQYHVHSDLVYLEVVDPDGAPVSSGEPGHIVVTRFYGQGTPIIRYTGLDDIITPTDTTCPCGITSSLIEKIQGRESQSLVLPGGKIILPLSLSMFFDEIAGTYDIDKIERFQMIQHKIDSIEIRVKINDELRNIGPPVDTIFSTIQQRFKEQYGPHLIIRVNEREQFEPHTPTIISKVDKSTMKKKIYI
jgi:phenylacetate-CoA ligase